MTSNWLSRKRNFALLCHSSNLLQLMSMTTYQPKRMADSPPWKPDTTMTRTILTTVLLLCAHAGSAAEEPQKSKNPLAAFHVLEGVWKGKGEGFGQVSAVTHEWKKVLGGKFMRLTTRSISNSKEGKTVVHEDVGFISWSHDEQLPRFRQFLSEGFVNTFRLEQASKPANGFNFEPESTEGYPRMAARMTLRFDNKDGYEMILELGEKGKPLRPCQTMNLKKVSSESTSRAAGKSRK